MACASAFMALAARRGIGCEAISAGSAITSDGPHQALALDARRHAVEAR